MKTITTTIAITCFGLSLAMTQDAWAWGEGRVKAGKSQLRRGGTQLNAAARHRGKIGKNLRQGVGYGLQVPGAAVAPTGSGKAMRHKSAKGFTNFAKNIGGSITKSIAGRFTRSRGRVNLAVGTTEQAVGNAVGNAKKAVWNSKPVSYMRLIGAASGIALGKLGRAIGGARRGLESKNIAAFVKGNGGAVPSRFKNQRAKRSQKPSMTGIPAKAVPSNQLMDMAGQLR